MSAERDFGKADSSWSDYRMVNARDKPEVKMCGLVICWRKSNVSGDFPDGCEKQLAKHAATLRLAGCRSSILGNIAGGQQAASCV